MHGWPESWYAWRLLMPALARDFEVIAVDQRGMGLSDKPQPLNDRLWHLGFNRIDNYVRMLSNPDSLRGSFGWYRALDTTIAQDEQRKSRRLTVPVLAIGAEASFGEHVADAVQVVADDVQSVVIPGTGHFVAEEAPEEMLAALTAFLTPYWDGSAAAHTPRPDVAAVR